MNLRNVIVSACILFGLNAIADSKNPAETYTTSPNPVIWADVPDPDVIRVGDDFYMVSTTMHLMPGCPIMHSKDLVNWEIINYVFDTLEDSPRYHLRRRYRLWQRSMGYFAEISRRNVLCPVFTK